MDDFEIDADGCVEIRWHEISEEDRNGVILGHTINFHTDCFPEGDPSRHSGHVDVMAPSTDYKLCDLRPGLQYRIGVAGFTSNGLGPSNDREIFTSKLRKTFSPLLFTSETNQKDFSFCLGVRTEFCSP